MFAIFAVDYFCSHNTTTVSTDLHHGLQVLTNVETLFEGFKIKTQLTVLWSDDSKK